MCSGVKLMAALGSACAVAACAVAPPRGPTVMALPPQGKNLAMFQQEDGQCRNYAAATIGYLQPGQAGTPAVVGSAAAGTLLGAAAGSAIGAAAGNAGAGAAIGGATGLVGGAAVGANNAAAGEYDLQTRYDIAYTQCMYSRGNTVQGLPPGGYGYYGYGYGSAGYPWYGYPCTAGGVLTSSEVAFSRFAGIAISIMASMTASMTASTGASMGASTAAPTGARTAEVAGTADRHPPPSRALWLQLASSRAPAGGRLSLHIRPQSGAVTT